MSRRTQWLVVALIGAACSETPEPGAPGRPLPASMVVDATAPVLVGAGDIAFCTKLGDEATAGVLDTVSGIVMAVGDNAYDNGSATDYATCYDPSWGRHKARTRPAPGNHDYNTPGAAGYFGYFGPAAGDPAKGYYSYEVGSWHVVVLNSNIDISAASTQLQWLKSDLATSQALCTAAYWHHPRFSSSAAISSATKQMQRPAWDVLWDAGVDVVVNGHAHHYERFAPQTPAGAADAAYGIREFVVGTGGESYYPFDALAPNSEVRNNTTVGVLKITLDSAGYTWRFIPGGSGTFSDAGSGGCHGVPPNQPPTARPGGPYLSLDGTVHFDASASSDPDGNLPLAYQWDFGDGNVNDDGARPSHTYMVDGTYLITLTVIDSRGGRSQAAVATAVVTRTTTTVVFTGAANIARCSNTNGEATAKLLDPLSGFVFAAGDNAFPNASATDYTNCYRPTWGRHKSRTFAVLGNHEYDLGNANGAFGYYGSRVGPAGKGYYSLDVGTWHVVVLNDNGAYVPYAAGSAQEQWLKADLAANPRKCTLALWHVPLFLSSNTAGYTVNPSRKILWTDLYAAGADLVVNGHQHHYERMALMDPTGAVDSARGIKEFNIGTGGESVTLPTVFHVNSEVRAAVYGVLKLTLKDGGYDWEFVPVAGQTFRDAGSGTCH